MEVAESGAPIFIFQQQISEAGNPWLWSFGTKFNMKSSHFTSWACEMAFVLDSVQRDRSGRFLASEIWCQKVLTLKSSENWYCIYNSDSSIIKVRTVLYQENGLEIRLVRFQKGHQWRGRVVTGYWLTEFLRGGRLGANILTDNALLRTLSVAVLGNTKLHFKTNSTETGKRCTNHSHSIQASNFDRVTWKMSLSQAKTQIKLPRGWTRWSDKIRRVKCI